MQKVVEDKIHELRKLCKKYDLKIMHVFVSAATDKFNETCDIDILIMKI